MFGAARCHWTKAKTVTAEIEDKRRCRNKLTEYEGDEIFINHKTVLFTHQNPVEMSIGTKLHEFSFHLPPTLPASFEGRFGCIQYHIEAVLYTPANLNKEYKLPFTVVRYDNLNKQPDLKLPVNIKETETFCFLCCRSEPMTMNVTLPYSGFTTSQRIPVTVNYVNKSDVEIIRTSISLYRKTKYTSTTPKIKTKTEEEKMAETFDYDGLGAIENTSFTKTLLMPQILPNSNVEFCKTVQISYEVRVRAETAGFSFDVATTIPITIGTVPLKFDDAPLNVSEISPFMDASAPPPDIRK